LVDHWAALRADWTGGQSAEMSDGMRVVPMEWTMVVH